MTDDRNMTTGLALLAEEAEIQQIDTYAVIAAAKARTRNRRLTAASALGTLAVAGAMVATMGGGWAGSAPAGGNPSTSPPAGVVSMEKAWEELTNPKLNQQLAHALPEVIPARFTIEWPDANVKEPTSAWEPTFFAGDPSPLSDEVIKRYSTGTYLKDAEGLAAIDFTITKRPAGSPLEHLNGWPIGPCAEGAEGCTRHELPDGTVAAVQLTAERHVVTAQRPDGTYLQVVTYLSPEPKRSAPPLTEEELLKFATVFTY